MKYNSGNILYTDKKSFLSLMKIISLIILIVNLVYFFNSTMSYYLIGLINIMIIFSITLISASTRKFPKNKLFFYWSIYFIILVFLTCYSYIFAMDNINFNRFSYLYIINITTLIESLFCLFLSKSLNIKEYKKTLLNYIIISIIFCTAVMGMIEVTSFFIFGILLLSLRNLRFTKLIKGSYINVVKIYNIMLIISEVLILTLYNNYYINNYVILIKMIFKFIIYLITYHWLIKNLVKKQYNPLFKEDFKRNDELKEINKKLRNKIKDLEQFQKEDKRKKRDIRKLFDNIPLPIIIISESNYRIIYGNKNLFNIFKKEPRLIINKKIDNLLKINNINEFLKQKRWEGNVSIEGKELILHVEILAIQEQNYVLLIKDVTELKRKTKRKDEFDKKSLEEGIRNEFLSNISHDLKTPINVIYTACQLQSSFLSLDNINIENVKKYNNVNKENCMTLTRLANNLIDSSKLSYDYLKPQCEVYNIVELVEESANSLVEYIKDKDIEFQFDTEEEEVWVRCDKEFIERIVINLMSNAIKHTSKGSIKVTILADEFKARIEFADTGEGMDKEFTKKAFKKYSIEKTNRGGYRNKSTGIGLFVVKNLVELQGGEIYIQSEKYKGTIVKLEFFREKINA